MDQLQIYQLDLQGVWDGKQLFAKPDPYIDGRFLVPGACVTVAPPVLAAHQVAQYDGAAWHVVADWRGHIYWMADSGPFVITDLGIEPPAGALDAEPAPSLAKLRDDKAKALEMACAEQIVGGFQSNALGPAHTYPSKITDQMNLTASVTAGLVNTQAGWTTPFWCCDQAGVWAWLPHTFAQIKQVGEDAMAAVLAAQAKNAGLQAQIAMATAEQLASIHW
jgi:hypothetical protein